MDSRSDDPAPWRLLGPVRWQPAEVDVDLGPAKQRCVVAVLLMTPGHSVPVATLVDRVWGERAPRTSNPIAPYAARLRRLGGALGLLRFASGGYRIEVPADDVDVHRARRLVTAAREAAGDEGAVTLLRRALAGWEPVALAGLTGAWAARVRETLQRERLDLIAEAAEAEVRLGRPEAVVDQLRTVAAEHPTTERLTAVLMRALHDSGRVAEALECYARLRSAVADEFGSEPGAAVRDLHVELLRRNRRPGAGPGVPDAAGPAQLPSDVGAFTGREDELFRLDEALADDRPVVLSGTAGVGKTALAVHWAHRVRDRFPGGQLFVNLAGFGPDEAVVPPEEALRGFLEALGVPGSQVPRELPDRSALFRTLVAGRRLLIILDNARDADQVRPLLPGGPGSVVVITSRDPLLSLVALETARPLAVGLLDPAAARALLSRRLGAARVNAEPEAVRRLTAACAHLPIALAIVAAHAASRPDLPLAALAGQLGTGDGLDLLDGHDASSNVRVVFSWSYRTLTPAAARLFRLLGLHPGPEVTENAATSLAGAGAGPQLDELVRAHILAPTPTGRYELHDLLRAYAGELAGADEPAPDRRDALHRLLDHYLHGACIAMRLNHTPSPLTPPPPQPGVVVDEIADDAAALSWLMANDPVLTALIRRAGPAGFDGHVWRLVRARDHFAVRRGRWNDLLELDDLGLHAARRTGDRTAEAQLLRSLARAHLMRDHHDEARRHALTAAGVFRELGDRTGEAQTHHFLADVHGRMGEQRTALDHARASLRLYEAGDDPVGTARALNAAGWCHAVLGEHGLAVDHCERALALFRAAGDRDGEAATQGSLGYAREHSGDPAAAIGHYERAARLCREIGERFFLADTLTHLGDCHSARGDASAARAAWSEARDIFAELRV
ncbi:AfsR/SARP family transcriptional regulator [Paractinoplanes lichenicola]|uniref:Tetratricopeptide repeat protein n=1 Tax=Paractinoplanes lichenicola TaxID=2802976 RepID=A0ABS1VMC6_9ACTN|nr:BTAD domain-containing putative transcriptional regulator [Actinoplanes lichenicola]MBL7255879.1 tetratricopeptide repeat protein [Actinoplanes lichenicola]